MRAARRKGMAWGDLLVALLILLLAAALAWTLRPRPEQGVSVRVALDGEALFSCPLDGLEEPVELPVDGPYPLTLELSGQGVRVIRTACPGADCLHMGRVSAAGGEIICLPNRMVVTLEGGSPSYDAMTG